MRDGRPMRDSYVVYCCRPTSVYMALIKNEQKFITLAMKVVERFVKKIKTTESARG